MATATNSTEGEIVLGGDLTGTADAPELVSTGVIPGVYSPVQRMYVDAKGRIVSVGSLTAAEMTALPLVATDSVKGVFSFNPAMLNGGGCGVLALNTATSSVKGAFSLGAGLSGTGVVSVNESGLPATGSVFGFVKSGANITNTAGVLSIADATDSVKGVFSLGSGLSVVAGAVVVDESTLPATGGSLGFVHPTTNITTTGGVISLEIATGSVFGLVKSGGNITNTAGVLSIADATDSVKGVASFNSTHFTVSSGAVSVPSDARTNVANTYTKSNNGAVQTVAGGSTYTPNFQTGEAIADITLDQNLTINFPSVLAPSGTVVRRNIVLRFDAGTSYTVTLSGTYLTNRTMTFTNAASAAVDNLTLICTDTVCYAILNETFL